MVIKILRDGDTVTGYTVDQEPNDRSILLSMSDVLGRRIGAAMLEAAGGKAAAVISKAHGDLVAALAEYDAATAAGSDAGVAGATLARTLNTIANNVAHGTVNTPKPRGN